MNPTPIPRLPDPKPGDLIVSKTGTTYRIQVGGYWQKEPWENLTSQEQEEVERQLRALERQQKAAAQR